MFRANIYVLLLSYFQSPPRKNFINGILFSFLNSSGKNSHCKTLFLVRKRKISFFVALFRLANIQRKRYYLGKQVGRRVIRPLSYACSVQIALGSAPNGSAQVPPPPREQYSFCLSLLSLCARYFLLSSRPQNSQPIRFQPPRHTNFGPFHLKPLLTGPTAPDPPPVTVASGLKTRRPPATSGLLYLFRDDSTGR